MTTEQEFASDTRNLYLLQFTTAFNITQISLVSRLWKITK